MVQQVEIIYTVGFYEATDNLIQLLHSEGYFGFIEDAENYVDSIYDFIENNITVYPSKNSPENYQQYGEKYLFYKANPNTTWYIFFSQVKQTYLVQYIANNHTDFIANLNL